MQTRLNSEDATVSYPEAIQNWLNERQELVIQYCQISALPPYQKPNRALPSVESLNAFCGVLLDYISAGHFEIYERLMQSLPDNVHVNQTQLNEQIATSTDIALTFNDKYAQSNASDTEQETCEIDLDLSRLGKVKEKSFELEDFLLKHTQQQQPA